MNNQDILDRINIMISPDAISINEGPWGDVEWVGQINRWVQEDAITLPVGMPFTDKEAMQQELLNILWGTLQSSESLA